MCKIGTVIINCMIWDKHASMEGLIALFVCIFWVVLPTVAIEESDSNAHEELIRNSHVMVMMMMMERLRVHYHYHYHYYYYC